MYISHSLKIPGQPRDELQREEEEEEEEEEKEEEEAEEEGTGQVNLVAKLP